MKNYFVVFSVREYDYHENTIMVLENFIYEEVDTSNLSNFLFEAAQEFRAINSVNTAVVISWQEVKKV